MNPDEQFGSAMKAIQNAVADSKREVELTLRVSYDEAKEIFDFLDKMRSQASKFK